MRLVIAVPQVMHVVGGDQRHVQVARDRQQAVVDDALLVDALDTASRGRNCRRRGCRDSCAAAASAFFACSDRISRRDFALEAAAQADQPLGVLREQLLVDARLVIEALGVAGRDQLDQVLEALLVLGEQHEVVGGLAGRAALVAAIAGRDVDLAAEDRLDAALARRVVKDDRREHVAVLGDGERRHLELLRLIEQLVDAAGAVEQRELGVQVKVDEVMHIAHHSHSIVEGGFELMS